MNFYQLSSINCYDLTATNPFVYESYCINNRYKMVNRLFFLYKLLVDFGTRTNMKL
jgi:hypothetical protein